MKPVKTVRSNLVYAGPRANIGDLDCEREHDGPDTIVWSVWEPTPAEREQIRAGARIKLGIFNHEPIPPVALCITTEELADEAAEKPDVEAHEGPVVDRDAPKPPPPGPPDPPKPPDHRPVA